MRIPFIAGNWKMFKTVAETVDFVKEFRNLVKDVKGVEIVLAPPFTAVHAAATAARNSNVGIAAQDMHWENEGAFTGAIGATMIRETGAKYVIIGHSERRTLFGETDKAVNRKVTAALAAKLVPIMCVGETLQQRKDNKTFAVLDQQVREGLDALTPDQVGALIMAYEPVWAIGTGQTATAAQAEEAHGHIRQRLKESFSHEAAKGCRLIYGGSVKPANTAELLAQPDVDGALVGGSSLDVGTFLEIVNGTV